MFKDPVPRTVEGYYDTIKKPMDLRTIAGGLVGGVVGVSGGVHIWVPGCVAGI